MTKTVTANYSLSEAGRRAALLAGRPATQSVTERMEVEITPELLASLTIRFDGSLVYDAQCVYDRSNDRHDLELNAPPASLSDLIVAYQAHSAAIAAADAANAAKQAERQAQQEREEAARLARIEADRQVVEAVLATIEAADPLADLPAGVQLGDGYSAPRLYLDERRMWVDGASAQRIDRIIGRRNAARRAADEAAAEAARAAKQAERDQRIAEHGGHWWAAEGGMCDFRGYGLWSRGQSRRWVGVFTEPKGIAQFLEGSRGEHTWDVSGLEPRQCIQGGGFDTNSRGKRRNETEFFGVVIRNDATGLVVEIVDSRTAALQRSRKREVAS